MSLGSSTADLAVRAIRRVSRAMGKYEWLLFLHVTGAFLFLGAAVVAGADHRSRALRRERPSEIALLLRLAPSPVVAVVDRRRLARCSSSGSGSCTTPGYGYGRRLGGRRARPVRARERRSAASAASATEPARELAERLAAEGDAAERGAAGARCATRVTLALDYGAALAALAVLVLMIWKPGAGDDRARSGPTRGTPALRCTSLGAIVLFGGVGAVAVLALAAQRTPAQRGALAGLAFVTLLARRLAGLHRDAGRRAVDRLRRTSTRRCPTGSARLRRRRRRRCSSSSASTVLGWLALGRRSELRAYVRPGWRLYLVALGVAWWAMSAKPGA